VPLKGIELPQGCSQLIAHYKKKAETWKGECCGFWTKLKRIILKAAYYVVLAIVKAVLAVPRVLLKIANAVLLVVEIALKVARFALNAALCIVLAFVGAWDKILDKVGAGGYFHRTLTWTPQSFNSTAKSLGKNPQKWL